MEKALHYILILITYLITYPVQAAGADRLVVTRAEKETTLMGYTRTIKSQAISPEVSGKIVKVNYDTGDAITDKSFMEIDPTFTDYEIERTVRSIDRLETVIEKARSRVIYLEKESIRIEELFKEDMVPASRRDSTVQDLDQARLELDASLKEQAVRKTELDELKERRRRHSIYAPQGWVVTDLAVEENEVVQPGMYLARVSDYRKLVVPLYVSSDELSAINALPTRFSAELEGSPVSASVHWINPEFNEETRKIQIELIISNYNNSKRGGLKFVLPVKVKTEGLYIPKSAVTTRYENPTVTIKDRKDVIRLFVLGDAGDYLLVADDDRLPAGTELEPVHKDRQNQDR